MSLPLSVSTHTRRHTHIQHTHPQSEAELGQIGVQCWLLLLQVAGHRFTPDAWTQVLDSLSSVLQSTLPHVLCSAALRASLQLPAPPPAPVPLPVFAPEPDHGHAHAHAHGKPPVGPGFNPHAVVTKFKVHLMLVDAAREVVMLFSAPPEEVMARASQQAARATPTPIALPKPDDATGPHAEGMGEEDIAISREVVERVRRASTTMGKTRVYHGPTASIGAGAGVALSGKHVLVVLRALAGSIEFARRFNADLELRTGLQRAGLRGGASGQPPELWYQEAHGLRVALQLLFSLYARDPAMEEALLQLSRFVLQDYAERAAVVVEAEGLRCMDGVVCAVLEGLGQMEQAQFDRNFPEFFPFVNEMIAAGSPTIRAMVRHLFETRFKSLFLK